MPVPSLMTRERERVSLLVILAVALVIRFVHFLIIVGTAFPKFPLVFDQSDLNTYWEWAQAIVAGDWLGRQTYHPAFEWMKAIAPEETWYRWWGGKEIFQQAPFYPYLVAGLLAVSRGSIEFVSAVQLVLGALQPLVMFWLGRRLFNARVGLLAAALTALYGPFIFHQGVLLRDWLPPVLEPLSLVAFLKARESGRILHWVLAGMAVGLAVLAKETLLLFLPLALLWILLGQRHAIRGAIASCAAVLAGLMLIVAPLVVRNVTVGGPPFAFSNRAAEGLIEGNAADGFPIGLTHPPSMKGILERSDGRLPAVIRETLRTYHGRWMELARLELLKLRALADPLEVPNNLNFYYGREISPILRLMLTYGVIFPFGVAGFVLALSTWRHHLLLILYGVSTLGSLLSTIVLARFRLALVPVLIIYAAAGLVWLWDAVSAKRMAAGITYISLLVGFAVTQHLVLPIPALRGMHRIAVHRPEYLLAAYIYAHDGRFDRAVTEVERLEKRAAERPSFAELAREASLYDGDYRTQWARQLIREGKADQGRRQVLRVEAAYSAHQDLSYPLFNLGFLHLDLGDRAKAKEYFERFLGREPQGPRADQVRRAWPGL
jgi:dolichyl-phosphate-mannose-protein mannosyltransferase/tetratricopeptide repeat protein